MRRRDGSTARTHDRLENTTAGDRNSNEVFSRLVFVISFI
jgi:hypothetical protein